jgi:hypothetical protein
VRNQRKERKQEEKIKMGPKLRGGEVFWNDME